MFFAITFSVYFAIGFQFMFFVAILPILIRTLFTYAHTFRFSLGLFYCLCLVKSDLLEAKMKIRKSHQVADSFSSILHFKAINLCAK